MDYYNNRLSVVVPLYNEVDNVEPLIQSIQSALSDYPAHWELILVDDGSIDGTLENLEKARAEYGTHVQIVALQRNFGQTAAMQAGIDAANGDIIATLDGDLQNDPEDIPRLIKKLFDDDLDLLVGWRRDRKDKLLLRKIPSWIANFLIGRVTGVKLHDYGCSLKIYRSYIIKRVRLYGEMHRFIPAWAAIATSPSRIKEEVVSHHPRRSGKTKYGLSRSFRVVIDLLSVYFFMRYRARPGHFFGSIGLIFGLVGSLILGYLAIVKFGFGEDIGTRPLLLVGVVFIIASIQFITTGITTELMSRTYFESSDVKPYMIRELADENTDTENSWHTHED
ncbi:MAG: glycosyltransferase family 2 protein [Candidatus Latescibacteria bacterium]|jgi:glycosyltransferase involved in cell wall biosynthesis|nr:glycosyltransferase family 2 protein [Candidatus Latescibacterota bacterium]